MISKKEYIIEVCQEFITPVKVTAQDRAEAKEKIMISEGEPGDSYFGKVKILSIKLAKGME